MMKRKLRHLVIAAFSLILSGTTAHGAEIDLATLKNAAGATAQKDFENLVRDVGRAVQINPGNSPEPLGLLGFNGGAEVSVVKIDERPIELATGKDLPGGTIPVPKLRFQKGLPWGFDIEGVLFYVPEVGISVWGGDIRYDLMEAIPLPTPLLHLSARLAYSKLSGIEELELQTFSYDLSAGINLPIVKPYVGAGFLNIDSKTSGTASLLFNDVNKQESRLFAGLKLTLIPFVPITFEYGSDSAETYSLKISAEF